MKSAAYLVDHEICCWWGNWSRRTTGNEKQREYGGDQSCFLHESLRMKALLFIQAFVAAMLKIS
jgi:hypothetical protein